MMPDFLRTPVLGSYSAELVAALFAAAVTLSFRLSFPRADLARWGAAWAASTGFAGLGLLAHTLDWSPTGVLLLRVVGRSGALLQAVLLLQAACLLTGRVPPWLRRAAYLVPFVAALTAWASAGAPGSPSEVASRVFASATVGVAALAAAARLRQGRPARPLIGTRLMLLGLGLYGVLKLFSPMTLGRLGLLQGSLADEAFFMGFMLGPCTFALGLVVSLLEERERGRAEEHERLRDSEKRLRLSEERLRRISEAAFEGIAFSENGRLIDANEQLARMLEYSLEEMVGKPVQELVAPEDRARVADAMTRDETSAYEHLALRRDGSQLVVESRARLLRYDDRTLRVTAVRDISEQAELIERLGRSERMAEVGRLVAGVAHEVRTPLFSISATLDAYENLLADARERRDFLELLRSQVQRLSGLMHDLLDYGRPAALRLAPGEIRSVLESAVRSCAAIARKAGVAVEASTAEAAGVQLLRDPDRLEQVFQNLLSNAIHHAPRGSVVRLGVTRQRAPEPGLVCTIEDEGPGLRPEDLPRLFEPFFSRRSGGIGLGLALVQRIVEEHGGSVDAANRPGGGARFRVSLSASRSRAA